MKLPGGQLRVVARKTDRVVLLSEDDVGAGSFHSEFSRRARSDLYCVTRLLRGCEAASISFIHMRCHAAR